MSLIIILLVAACLQTITYHHNILAASTTTTNYYNGSIFFTYAYEDRNQGVMVVYQPSSLGTSTYEPADIRVCIGFDVGFDHKPDEVQYESAVTAWPNQRQMTWESGSLDGKRKGYYYLISSNPALSPKTWTPYQVNIYNSAEHRSCWWSGNPLYQDTNNSYFVPEVVTYCEIDSKNFLHDNIDSCSDVLSKKSNGSAHGVTPKIGNNKECSIYDTNSCHRSFFSSAPTLGITAATMTVIILVTLFIMRRRKQARSRAEAAALSAAIPLRAVDTPVAPVDPTYGLPQYKDLPVEDLPPAYHQINDQPGARPPNTTSSV